jgi:hypothetical protein
VTASEIFIPLTKKLNDGKCSDMCQLITYSHHKPLHGAHNLINKIDGTKETNNGEESGKKIDKDVRKTDTKKKELINK